MLTDWPYRLTLIIITGIHLTWSRKYLKASKAGGTVFQKRAEGLPLSVALGVTYGAYSLAVLVYLINPAWMAWGTVPLGAPIRWLGAGVIALGAGLHLWGMHHLGKNLTISINTKDNHQLVTSGPFAWVRHPLYVGGMVESLGVCLLLSNAAVAVIAVVFWALIVYRTPREEAVLEATLGEPYTRYRQQIGRFLPRRSRR